MRQSRHRPQRLRRFVDLTQLRRTASALWTPFEHPTRDAWLLVCAAHLRELNGADATVVGISPAGQRTSFLSRDLPAHYLERVTRFANGPTSERGEIHSDDPSIERILALARSEVSRVAQVFDVVSLQGHGALDTPLFQEVAFPLGIPGSSALFHRSSFGEVIVSTMYSRYMATPLGEDSHAILGALIPALAAGFEGWHRLGTAAERLGAAFDQLSSGVIIYDGLGINRIAMNTIVRRLAANDPECRHLLRTADDVARTTARAADPKVLVPGAPVPRHDVVATTRARYRVSGARFPSGLAAPHEVVAVLVTRVDRDAPDLLDLLDRYGLTRREAEIARELSLGLSNRDIAKRLGLSIHTVRHHLERVFLKLGVSTRNEALMRLLDEDGGNPRL